MNLLVVPRTRTILTLDAEGSTTRTNTGRALLRRAMYELLEEALRSSGISREHHDEFSDRGDGALVLIHPVDEAPKTILLTNLIPTLSALLADHAASSPEQRFRLRAAVHAGDVHFDERGCYGEDIDLTFRLLNAPALKRKLRETGAPLVLAVSQDIHHSLIRHGYDGIDGNAFEPLLRVRMAGHWVRGWVQVPNARESPATAVSASRS
jgi:class 3 adenylate cyclase